jgi:hypothetical protein
MSESASTDALTTLCANTLVGWRSAILSPFLMSTVRAPKSIATTLPNAPPSPGSSSSASSRIDVSCSGNV